MKQPKKPVTMETLDEGTLELAAYVETTSFAGEPGEELTVNMAENQPRDEDGRWTSVGFGTQVDEEGLAKHRQEGGAYVEKYNRIANGADAMVRLCELMGYKQRDSFARRDIANALITSGYDSKAAQAAQKLVVKKLEAMADKDEGVGYVSTVPLWFPERYMNSDNRGFYVTDLPAFEKQMRDWAADARVEYMEARQLYEQRERGFFRDTPKINEFDAAQPRDDDGKWTAEGAQAAFDAKVKEHKTQSREDILSVLQGAAEHMSTAQLITALSKQFPERWTTFYRVGKETARRVMAVLRELELDVQDNAERHRGRRGGMGKSTHFKTYKLKGEPE